MRLSRWIFLLFVVPTGCIQSHRAPPVVYYAPATPVLTPTSDSPAPRVYAPVAPPDVSPGDLSTAEAVQHLLNDDAHLAGASADVLVTVRGGVVTLRGTTPTEHDRYEIVERVAKIPGIVKVDDQLGISDER
jgi:BON domain